MGFSARRKQLHNNLANGLHKESEEVKNILADLGYEGVEFGIRNPDKIDSRQIEQVLGRNSLRLSAIGTGQMFVDDGLSISSLSKDIRHRAISRIRKHIVLARLFESQVIIGLARGKKSAIRKNNDSRYMKYLKDGFREICDCAEKNKVAVTIEPINRYETSFLNCAEEVKSFERILNSPSLKIMLDTFHANIEEKNFLQAVKISGRFLSHVHLSDNNRLCPGRGHLDFKLIIGLLRKSGYVGYLSAEILPFPDFKACAKEYITNIRRYL